MQNNKISFIKSVVSNVVTLIVFVQFRTVNYVDFQTQKSAIEESLSKTLVKMDKITAENYGCSARGCLTTLKTKPQSVNLFAIPQNISENWRNVLNKPDDWVPKKL